MLSLGSSGDDVRELQQFLNTQGCVDDAGNPLVVDGNFGVRTGQALRAFQRQHGLAPDGVFGPQTEAVARTLRFGASARIEGVDVSIYCTDGHGKSFIDWPALAPQPRFFWARSSAGVTADGSYAGHVRDGARIQAVPGAYHFFIAGDDPVAQAKAWKAAAGAQPSGQTLRPALDIENNRVDANKNPVPLTDPEARTWEANARTLILSAEDLFGRSVAIYVNPKTAYEMRKYLDDFWSSRLLWLAEYTNGPPSVPAPWTSCAAHQFAGDVRMPGARCLMDRNVIYDPSMLEMLKT